MNRQERLEAAVSRLGAATDEIASDLKSLRDEITQGNLSDASLDKLDANISSLEALGRDPENPVPETTGDQVTDASKEATEKLDTTDESEG